MGSSVRGTAMEQEYQQNISPTYNQYSVKHSKSLCKIGVGQNPQFFLLTAVSSRAAWEGSAKREGGENLPHELYSDHETLDLSY